MKYEEPSMETLLISPEVIITTSPGWLDPDGNSGDDTGKWEF